MGKDNITLYVDVCIFEPTCSALGISPKAILCPRLEPQRIEQRLLYPVYHSKKPYYVQFWKEVLISFIWHLGFSCFYRRGFIFRRLPYQPQTKKIYRQTKPLLLFNTDFMFGRWYLSTENSLCWTLLSPLANGNEQVQFLHKKTLIQPDNNSNDINNGKQLLTIVDKIYSLILSNISSIKIAFRLNPHQQIQVYLFVEAITLLTVYILLKLKTLFLTWQMKQGITNLFYLPKAKTLVYPINLFNTARLS